MSYRKEMYEERMREKAEIMKDWIRIHSEPVAIVMCMDDLEWNDYHIRNTNELITWIGTGVNDGKQQVVWKSEKAPNWKILG